MNTTQKWITRKLFGNDAPSGNKKSIGFERSNLEMREDRLGRVNIARQAYGLLTELPPEWSVRVGLNGSWGSGKTTIANWIAHFAEQDKHIVVWLNPWSARSVAEVWLAFAVSLFDALETRGVSLSGLTDLRNAVRLRKFRSQLEQLSDLSGISAAGVALVQTFFPINAAELKTLRQKLGDHRVLVIVDDLDRADPHVLPQALLAVRELLDFEGFSFLLPFDEEIVGEALKSYNPALQSGQSFVEKILDFRLNLPSPTPTQRQQLFADEMSKHCDFIPGKAIIGFDDILPSNPRKLKGIIRSLMYFRTEALRHRTGDLDWDAVIFGSMLRQESASFYEDYVLKTFGNPETTSWISASMGDKKDVQQLQERLTELAKKHAPDDQPLQERLYEICETWRKRHGFRSSVRVAYSLRMLDRPDAVTWPEYEEALSLWKTRHQPSDVFTWIDAHARKHGLASNLVAHELVSALLDQYNYQLEKASNTELLQEHTETLRQAIEVLQLLDELLTSRTTALSENLLTPSVFEKLLSIARDWRKFCSNPQDKVAREQEGAMLKKLVSEVGAEWEPYEQLIRSMSESPFSEDRFELCDELSGAFRKAAEKQALQAFSEEGAMQQFVPRNSNVAARRQLLDITSALWLPATHSPIDKALQSADSNPNVQKNALQLLKLVVYIIESWGEPERTLALALVVNADALSVLWKASIAQPLQFRRLKDVRDVRAKLVSFGARESDLFIPEWLRGEEQRNEEVQRQ